MTLVRFASTCDHACEARSAEYTAFPTCRECDRHTCPAHAVPGSLHETDGESAETVLCLDCEPLERAPILRVELIQEAA